MKGLIAVKCETAKATKCFQRISTPDGLCTPTLEKLLGRGLQFVDTSRPNSEWTQNGPILRKYYLMSAFCASLFRAEKLHSFPTGHALCKCKDADVDEKPQK